MSCTNCGSEVAENAVVCVKCGVPPCASKKFCRNCGVAVNENQVVCVKCGSSLAGNGAAVPSSVSALTSGEKSRIVAAVLALLLGGLGVHKFYYGSWGYGLVYIVVSLFTCGGLPALLGVVEAIMLFCMSDEDFNKK